MADEIEILYQKTVTLVSPEDEIAGRGRVSHIWSTTAIQPAE